MQTNLRYNGILIHPSSISGPHGIGCLGQEAKALLLQLSRAKVNIWQILPLGPTGYGDSPYSSRSTFAGNELLIDLRQIPYAKLSLIDGVFEDVGQRINYEEVRKYKSLVLFDSATQFLEKAPSEELAKYQAFCDENSWWLDDYALFQTLCDVHNDSRWPLWPQAEAMRKTSTLTSLKKTYALEIARYKVLQYYFYTQWQEIHEYANSLGIRILGDIPIFVAPDSVDAWTNKKLFKIDKDGKQTKLAGCPPDFFCPEGQLWGNPVYNWTEHKKDNYSWWNKRVTHTLKMVDMIRLDHFRGFEAAWEVPEGSVNAVNGKWVKGPGTDLFFSLPKDISVIAEDLGVITKEVNKMRLDCNYPGMKILQFAFNIKDGKLDTTNPYLPHNYEKLCASYTGTHDNETLRGWFDGAPEEIKDVVRRYLQCPNEEVVWQSIRAILSSSAQYAITAMQDLLGLGNEARMNTPSTVGSSNWSWRMAPWALNDWTLERYKAFVEIYGRTNDEPNSL